VNGELFPANVERLRSRGVSFTWRKQERDIKMECPSCGNVLILHDDKPFHYCGWPTCHAWMLPFEDVIKAIAVERVKVAS
jgi:predicted RNA-binding Zn-ribbon protein involved in translation (DUF1610 family)